MEKLIPVEWSDRRVLLSSQVAEVYGCTTNSIKENFRRAKEHFVEGVHYFKIEGAALKKLRSKSPDLQISPMTRLLYLWTEEGATLHCKMINTDKAWGKMRELVTTYFARRIVAELEPKPEPEPKPRRPLSELAVCYAFDMSDDTTKIGITGNVADRTKRIQRETKLQVREECHTPYVKRDRARRIETTLHRKYAAVRVGGEFFRVGFSEAKRELERLCGELAIGEETISISQPVTEPVDLADRLIAIAKTIQDETARDKILLQAANLLIGRNIF